MKMKNLMAVGFTAAMLMGSGSVSAATVTYLNDGTSGTFHHWTDASSGYNPSVLDPQLSSSPHQQGALSGSYGGTTSGIIKNFNTVKAGAPKSGDIWKLNVDTNATVSLSVDYQGSTINKLGITAVELYSDSTLTTLVAAGVGSTLANQPWTGLGFSTYTFSTLNLLSATNYYLRIVGSYTGASTSGKSAYSIGTPAANTLSSATPIPGAVWLFGSGIAGLIGASKRKKAKAALTA